MPHRGKLNIIFFQNTSILHTRGAQMTDCIHANECTNNNSYMCSSCRHNRGKKNYYEPLRPFNPEPWYPKSEPYPNPWQPTWIGYKDRYETYKDKTGYRLGPELGYRLGIKPSPKLKTPFFLS